MYGEMYGVGLADKLLVWLVAGLLLLPLLALIPATIARSKGRRFFVWWLYGVAFWIIALVHSLVAKRSWKGLDRRSAKEGLRRCVACAEWIRPQAKICRYCQTAVDAWIDPNRNEL